VKYPPVHQPEVEAVAEAVGAEVVEEAEVLPRRAVVVAAAVTYMP
jgi:hypothetical protein